MEEVNYAQLVNLGTKRKKKGNKFTGSGYFGADEQVSDHFSSFPLDSTLLALLGFSRIALMAFVVVFLGVRLLPF